MFEELQLLNKQNFTRFQDQQGLEILPDGAVMFNKVDSEILDYKVQVNDVLLQEYHRLNGFSKIQFNIKEIKKLLQIENQSGSEKKNRPILIVPEAQLALVDMVNRAYINSLDPNAMLVSGTMYMPLTDGSDQFLDSVINMSGGSLFPLALGLLLPVFMYQMVLEKEQKIIQIMKMNGLKMSIYWLSNFLFNFFIYFITVFIFLLFGFLLLATSFFTQTSFTLFFILFIGWGFSQISTAFFIQIFINKAKTASIVGYILSIWLILTAVSFNIGIYPYPQNIPYFLRMIPTFGFSRVIYRLAEACSQGQCLKQISVLNNGVNDEIKDCILWMYITSLLLFILTFYFDQIIPQEYGVNKHPLFPIHSFLNIFKTKSNNNHHHHQIVQDDNIQLQVEQQQNLNEDQDVIDERQLAYQQDLSSENYPLLIQDLRKEYNNGNKKNVAVKQLSLTVQKGEILGLLGPNGAGKTSLISMLTGLYPVSKGNAFINGYSIKENIEVAQKYIGICPQFDLQWPQLTVEEHLLFYCRLKGVEKNKEKEMVNNALESVLLISHRHKESQQLSGGMRRRLSVAISMVGNPSVIFLDEPTTGLDPENRRQLWDIIINKQKINKLNQHNQSIIITTHSMEEADVLCNRIGILQFGYLRCIAPQLKLKQIYGGGYHLFINLIKNNQQQNYQLIIQNLIDFVYSFSKNNSIKLINRVNGNLDFIISDKSIQISNIFQLIEDNKSKMNIQEWGISQSSLEDVFVHIVNTFQQ